MTSYTWNGTTNQTASKADLGSINFTFNPATTLANVQQSGTSVVFTSVDNHTFTVTGVTLAEIDTNGILLNGGVNTLVQFGDGSTTTDTDAASNYINANGTDRAILLGLGGKDEIHAEGSGSHFILGGSSVTDTADTGDSIYTGSGTDVVYGNGGDDYIHDAGGTDNKLYGGTGDDLIEVNSSGMSATISSSSSTDFRDSTISGGDGNDTIHVYGAAGFTEVYGGNGVTDSDPGNDNIYVDGAGVINMYGNAGADTLGGYASNYEYYSDNSVTTILSAFGGQGNDSINLGGDSSTTINAFGGVGSDTINVHTAGVANIYGGTSATDSTDAADNISFGDTCNYDGHYTVYGNGGNDVINGNLGFGGFADVYGGQGDDTIAVNGTYGSANITITGGVGADTLSSNSDGHVTIYGGNGLTDAADGADTINFNGAGQFDVYGNGGNDVITGDLGTSGTATVYGGQGDDTITVNSELSSGTTTATATLNGGIGNDILTGGAGVDQLTGGAGADTFRFASRDQSTLTYTDTITDFSHSSADLINLHAVVNGAAGYHTNTVDLSGDASLSAAVDHLSALDGSGNSQVTGFVYHGETYVLVDNSAAATYQADDMLIHLNGVVPLVSADFVF